MKINWKNLLQITVNEFHDRYLLLVLLLLVYFLGKATNALWSHVLACMTIGFFSGIAASDMRRARKLRRIVDSIGDALCVTAEEFKVKKPKQPDVSVN